MNDQLQQLKGRQASRQAMTGSENPTRVACRIEGEVGMLNSEGGVDDVDASASGCRIALEGAAAQD